MLLTDDLDVAPVARAKTAFVKMPQERNFALIFFMGERNVATQQSMAAGHHEKLPQPER